MSGIELPDVYSVTPRVLHPGEAALDRPPRPALVLNSRHLVWPFDPSLRPLAAPADARGLARHVGLHPVSAPFGPAPVPAAGHPWQFCLPTARRPAALEGPCLHMTLTRCPKIHPQWWDLAVTHGGRCQLLIAVCALLYGDDEDVAVELNLAAGDDRLYGATISVEF